MGKKLSAWFLAICFIVALLYGRALDPVPVRFPEAADAFLYDSFSSSSGAIVITLFGALLAWPMRAMARRYAKRAIDEPEFQTSSEKAKTAASWIGFVAWIGALATPPLVAYEARTYRALTTTGVVSRDYSGEIEQRPWSSLHHVELECTIPSGLRRNRSYNPILRLRFEGGGSTPHVLGLRPYRMKKDEAMTLLEEIRMREQAPLIWAKDEQQDAFRRRDENFFSCVDKLLREFPFENRRELYRQVASASLRAETLATYR